MDDLYEDDQLRGARHQEIERMLADADERVRRILASPADEGERRILAFPETIEYPSPEREFLREIETARSALSRAYHIASRCRSIDPGDADWLLRADYLGTTAYWLGRAAVAQDEKHIVSPLSTEEPL